MKNQQLQHDVAYPVLGRRTRLFLWGLTAQAREIRPRKNPTIPKLIPCQHAHGLPQRQALGGGLHKNPWFAYCSFQVSRCWRRRMLIPVAHSHVDRPAHGRAFTAFALRSLKLIKSRWSEIFKGFNIAYIFNASFQDRL